MGTLEGDHWRAWEQTIGNMRNVSWGTCNWEYGNVILGDWEHDIAIRELRNVALATLAENFVYTKCNKHNKFQELPIQWKSTQILHYVCTKWQKFIIDNMLSCKKTIIGMWSVSTLLHCLFYCSKAGYAWRKLQIVCNVVVDWMKHKIKGVPKLINWISGGSFMLEYPTKANLLWEMQ